MWGSQRRRWPSRPQPSTAACLKDTPSEWTLPRLPGEIFLSRRVTYHDPFLDLMTISEQSFLEILTSKCRRMRYIFGGGIKLSVCSIFRQGAQYLWHITIFRLGARPVCQMWRIGKCTTGECQTISLEKISFFQWKSKVKIGSQGIKSWEQWHWYWDQVCFFKPETI